MSIIKKIKSLFQKEKKQEVKEPIVKKKPKAKKQPTKEEIRAKQERANRLLKEQLEKEKREQQKQLASKKSKEQKTKVTTEKEAPLKNKTRRKERSTISEKEQEAEILAETNNSVLFIQATTKRLKVIEWQNNKKRIILNKEREIRRTHKGGWSQEKFQRFVDSQKERTFEWVESNLKKPGILRPPYNQTIIEADNEDLEINIKNAFFQI